MRPTNPVDSFLNGYPEMDLKKIVKDIFAKKESHLSYLESYSNYLGINWHRNKEFIPNDSTKSYTFETLQKRYFVVPIVLYFEKIMESTPQSTFKELLPFEKEFLTLAINYIRTAIRHQILFKKESTLKGDISSADDIAYVGVEFNFIGDSVDFKLIGVHGFNSFENFSSSLRFLDPRLLALMMVKLGDSHEKFKSLGINITDLKYQTNQGVFKEYFKSEIDSKPMQIPKDLKGDQPVILPENSVVVAVSESNMSNNERNSVLSQLKKNVVENIANENKMTSAHLDKTRKESKLSKGFEKAQMTNVISGYEPLARILERALDQAQNGKGNERHQVDGACFINQPICELGRLYGTGYNFGQAAKKAHETNQLGSKDAKLNEIYGAINYLAAAAILIEEKD